jgi:hypothetical protein
MPLKKKKLGGVTKLIFLILSSIETGCVAQHRKN